jgi:uncharacterized protein (DUF2062 family)
MSEPSIHSRAEPRKTMRTRLRELVSGDTRPSALAAAVALGVFHGCSPFYGLQTVLVLLLAPALRLNPFAAVLGSQVSAPPLGILIIGAETTLGEWLRYGRWLQLPTLGARETVHWIWSHALLSWVIGSLLVGAIFALVGGAVAWGVFRGLRRLRQSAAS